MGTFQFKYFTIQQQHSTLKVGTDAMILGAFVSKNAYNNILDVGTGTGVLVLMAKQHNPTAKITAIDIDPQSEMDCRINFNQSPWSDDLTYLHTSIFDFHAPSLFDCIISNPPYYEDGLLSAKEAINTAKHTKNFDLKKFFEVCSNLLTTNGEMWTILPSENLSSWLEYTASVGLYPLTLISVYAKPGQLKRIVLHLSKIKQTPKEITFTIFTNSNDYTMEYKTLTNEFHSKKL